MRKRSRIAFVFLIILVLGVIAWLTFRHNEPSYQGRPLSSWLKQLDDGSTPIGLKWDAWRVARSPRQAQAAEAIRQMGTNSFPYLLDQLESRDSAFRLKLTAFAAKHTWLKISPPSPVKRRRSASLAFEALGPIARPMVPELAKALNSGGQDLPQEAAISLAGIGPDGWNVLIAAGIPTNGWSGSCAIWALASHHIAVPQSVINALIKQTTNCVGSDFGTPGWALGELGQDPEHAVPALIAGLQSPIMVARWGATTGLGKFGTNAVSAVPALLNAIQTSDQTTSFYAEQALKAIDPEAAAKAGVK